jgi:predicted nucleic acid-binding protein
VTLLLLDASAVVDLLLRSERGEQLRHALAERAKQELFTVAHLDAEVFSAVARHHRAGELDAESVSELLHRLAALAVTRLPITRELLHAAWTMRPNVAARDGLYVAAAGALDAALVTTDERLARAVPDLVADGV